MHPCLPACLQSIDASRQRLGVESLDLVQFYWHTYSNKSYVAAALNLAALQVGCAGLAAARPDPASQAFTCRFRTCGPLCLRP